MKLTASALTGSRTFVGTIALFVLANAWSWLRHLIFVDSSGDDDTVGFPFPFLASGGSDGQQDFYVLGLLLNIVIALTVALLLTRISGFFVKPRN